ncbi:HipA family kinase [Salsuginibacillus kocurii]|uniref:HipA family kinase n=1 Tax=Salsuginibacillus kocurii TaxID=427078 RepID=UPI00035DBA5D|nr:HipA family kinase [Salsuginibacillus kocurii]
MTEQDIYPVKYIKSLRGAIAHVIQFSDGFNYVVKFDTKKEKREKELVNEYVVGQLATHLSLPTIPSRLVFIPEDFIKEVSSRKKLQPGYHYAILFIEESVTFPNKGDESSIGTVDNSEEELAGIVVFDQWVNNTDRGRNNILFKKLENSYYVYMIDHGRCFPGGYCWNSETLKEEPQYRIKMPVYKWILSFVESQDQLYAFAEKIKEFSNESIANIVQSIPEEWNATTSDKESLINYLINEKENLSKVVDLIVEKYGKKIGAKR